MSITVGIWTFGGLFTFTRWVSNTSAFRIYIENSTLLFRVTLSIVFVWSFPEEAPKLLDIFLTVSLQSGSYVPSDILRGLPSCCRVSDHLTSRIEAFLQDLDCPKVPCFTGAMNFSEVLLCGCERWHGKSSLWFLFLLFRDEVGPDGIIPFSMTVFIM